MDRIKKFIGIVGAAFGFSLAIPICIYYLNFRGYTLSGDPSVWGSFGDFFGGILNPIISLFTFILLIFITWTISNQSDDAQFNHSLRLRRMDAVLKINNSFYHIIEFNNYITYTSDLVLKLMNKEVNIESAKLLFEKNYDEILEQSKKVSGSIIFLQNLGISYSFLFKYNFRNDKFEEFLKFLIKMNDESWKMISVLQQMQARNNYENAKLQDNFGEYLDGFVECYEKVKPIISKIVHDLKKEI